MHVYQQQEVHVPIVQPQNENWANSNIMRFQVVHTAKCNCARPASSSSLQHQNTTMHSVSRQCSAHDVHSTVLVYDQNIYPGSSFVQGKWFQKRQSIIKWRRAIWICIPYRAFFQNKECVQTGGTATALIHQKYLQPSHRSMSHCSKNFKHVHSGTMAHWHWQKQQWYCKHLNIQH